MSVQTTYLENGEWATRSVNIGEILARNRELNMPANTPVFKPPSIGLLSRTLVCGPAIQWVLPARIRHPKKNDVVFVGDSFIQVKELVPSGHLEEIITKADFDAKIVAAKVINTRPELGLEDQGNIRDLVQDMENVPPQILVLILSSKEIIFMYARELPRGRYEFIHARRPLPAEVSSLEEYGRILAIDPRSRAMTISTTHQFFGVFALKPPRVMQCEMKNGPVNPILEEEFFRTEGDILKMEFLYPKANNPNSIVLMLVTSRRTGIHVEIYDWAVKQDVLCFNMLKITMMRRLPSEWGAPPILIPLIQSMSVLFVTPGAVHIFKDILEPDCTIRKYVLPPRDDLQLTDLIWTQWTRPMRHEVHNKEFDDIYLCREDGEVLYLEIKEGAVQRNSVLGYLGCSLDSGFAILDGGFEAGDLFVATGSLSSGGLFITEPRKPPKCVQKIPNWAPTLDSVIIAGQNQDDSPSKTNVRVIRPPYDRIFACSGAGNRHGAITEFRYGLEARIGLVVDQEDSAGITNLWTLPNLMTAGTYCLISSPLSSSLIFIPLAATEELYTLDEETCGLNLSAQTLAASCTADQVMVQITDISIQLTVLGNKSLRFSVRLGSLEKIIAATVHSRLSLLATAICYDDKVHIVVRTSELSTTGLRCDMFAEPYLTAYVPLCLLIEEIESHFFLFIGTREGKILVIEINYTRGLILALEQEILPAVEHGDSTACESLRIISALKNGIRKSTLFCGLRNGMLVPLDIEKSQGSALELKQNAPYKLGDTSARVRGYESDMSTAIIACGTGLWRLSFIGNDDCLSHTLDKILITDQNNPARMQDTIDVFCCADLQPNAPPGGLGGSLICFADNQLFACTLEKSPKPIPRQIHVPGDPKRIIYSKYLQKLVVAYNFVSYEKDGEYTRRYTRPKICFIDPDDQSATPPALNMDEGTIQQFDNSRHAAMPTGASGEKVTALFDWNFSSGEHAYNMIVVGTSQPRSTYTGRLIYISARTNPHSPRQVLATIKYIHTYMQPIRAVASYAATSLVLGVGDEIFFQTLNPSTKKWRTLPAYKMESTPLSITVKTPFIYVLTARHSLCILTLANDRLVLHAQDGTDREGLAHVNLEGESKITLTSNRGGALVGLSELQLLQDEKLIKPLFAAHTPQSVIRLSLSHRPYKSGRSEIIYGTALDGTIYRFTTLKEHEWRLLRFIQNLCLSHPIVCQYRARWKLVSEDLAPVVLKPESMHVDGDVLSRVVEHGAWILEDIMKKNSANFYTSSPRENSGRMDYFLDFATPVVGNVKNPFVAVISWMEELLRIEL
ncbi:hypothetical protein LOZ12_000873 [Ophidiomyces ophidiicola]|nr:hypothetical protein LOZ62_000499 [Ophidiomyces ophidiicola]KAI2011573.1 hypothetical protein LOZ50_000593 [Ophidiomyces ophidiicola]KAI2056413.1 hypothetical protein LOZ38_000163 [Ophidiomyces ophidiicola]KAI2082085.1 hypothetical protein LOZ39_000048 [Ophidiomyces ophidiicola]KAI2083449.1 hypothetical protein LOZ37_000176 [Ophidiomyces ophidiicola]